ncbi:MAG TPA: FtsX-like permease family protein [Pyrinomonadaceae bacterium]|nr:FtsX-like permease family protein [Pyrinomonadaceae bacterium]
MKTSKLVGQNLTYYRRTNLAVVLGVATAVAVLAGALLVGDSVRASLRDLVVQRLGETDQVITSNGFFREQLAADIQSHQQFAAGGFAAACPLIALEGTVTHESSRRVASAIRVYGVDEKFWNFHRVEGKEPPRNREVMVNEPLARELGAQTGDSLVVRIQKPSDIPVESLHSKKEDLGSTLRLTVREIPAADALGEFSIQPQQSAVRAVFVPLKLLQDEIGQPAKVNLILLSKTSRSETELAAPAANMELLGGILKERTSLDDFGIKLRILNTQQSLSIESSAGFVSDLWAEKVQAAAQSAHTGAWPFLSYLVNSIRRDDGREIPYSIVTGVDIKKLELMQHNELGHRAGCDASAPTGNVPATASLPPIMLNEWASSDLQVKVGDPVTLDYYLWLDEGKLATRSAQFRVACIIPIEGVAADRDLVPDYPGITESETLGDWDPPFPIDLKRIRAQDEDYWKKYRTTPKGFIPLEVGQSLWGSRFGKLTLLRVAPARGRTLAETQSAFERSLREKLDPLVAGFSVLPVRAQGLEASRGATDFGEYFLYFSFFLVISALLLTALFFKLGIEQRLREIGVLQAMGFPASKIRSLFLAEGLLLAVVGSAVGLIGALAYGELMMLGLRTWWVDAVGTTMLRLHVSPISLVLGVTGGILAALICVAWTLRGLRKQSTRSLVAGTLSRDENIPRRRDGDARTTGEIMPASRVTLSPRLLIASAFSLLAGLLLVASALSLIGQTPGFFGGGMVLLVAALLFQSVWLRRGGGKSIAGGGWWALARMGFRNATYRPGRSVVCIALIASAAFIIVSVDAFRRDGGSNNDTNSGSGGYPLLAESLLPIVHDPNTAEGQEALNLRADATSKHVNFARFRVRPGDDASCLNLYQPKNPKIIAPTVDFIRGKRFAFQGSLAASDEEKQNPWLLLHREFPDGAVPVIADANSLNYVLHLKLGEDLVLPSGKDGQPVRLRVVAALADSIFQSELVMAERNFLRHFAEEGYRLFLIETPDSDPAAVVADLEDRLSDFGFDVVPTAERLANFHRVENTYLSTFQMLGGLGLLLGTLGMAAILLRNVLERRRELALMRAVGYNSSHFTLMIIAENTFLLCCGLVTGTVCALLAIAPVFFSRQAHVGSFSLGLLLLAVLISGLTASILATWAALRAPLLPALRAE